ncbi:MAG: DUF4446 family protein [Candidatus Paceibacterota bacterium]|nr:MAG: DUF4446 family protein [Candidatus Paceibacterota bacterium]
MEKFTTLNNETFFILALALSFVVVFSLFLWIWRLERKIKKILGGGVSANIESVILENHKRIKRVEEQQKVTIERLSLIENKLRKSVRAIETIRFNPFKGVGVGGNQSFSSAFLNEDGDGLVLSGLYLRDRVSIYAKPLKNLQAEFELSEEEKLAIKKALDSTKN